MTTRRQGRVTRYDDGNGVVFDREQNNKQQEESQGSGMQTSANAIAIYAGRTSLTDGREDDPEEKDDKGPPVMPLRGRVELFG
jgi:hypothetical protein